MGKEKEPFGAVYGPILLTLVTSTTSNLISRTINVLESLLMISRTSLAKRVLSDFYVDSIPTIETYIQISFNIYKKFSIYKGIPENDWIIP